MNDRRQFWKNLAIAFALVGVVVCVNFAARGDELSARRHYDRSDPRPGKWCAWYLRRALGIPKSAFPKWGHNIAANFRFIGSPAPGPTVGAIVVWRHHVGLIVGRTKNQWIVKSGNDGGRVRERPRDVSKAIAFRYPHSRMAEQ
jgi:hypothetical protein